jgi:hypothetical protein
MWRSCPGTPGYGGVSLLIWGVNGVPAGVPAVTTLTRVGGLASRKVLRHRPPIRIRFAVPSR